MEQGRIAALHAFDQPVRAAPRLIPTGVYAIPELAMVGATEEELTDAAVPTWPGSRAGRELARGVISGDRDGLLKLLVSPEDRSILGSTCSAPSATDLVHIGQAVMAAGAGGLDFLVTAVFNYPTFAESYKVAALDADNRIKAMNVLRRTLAPRRVRAERGSRARSGGAGVPAAVAHSAWRSARGGGAGGVLGVRLRARASISSMLVAPLGGFGAVPSGARTGSPCSTAPARTRTG